jgi:hypothetical protein
MINQAVVARTRIHQPVGMKWLALFSLVDAVNGMRGFSVAEMTN